MNDEITTTHLPIQLAIAARLLASCCARSQIIFCVTTLKMLAEDNADVPQLIENGLVVNPDNDIETAISLLKAVQNPNPQAEVEA